MGRIQQVLSAVRSQIGLALALANAPGQGQVIVGWPTAPELSDISNQGNAQISIYPLPGGRRVAPRGFGYSFQTIDPITLSASATGSIITITGVVMGGLNIFAYLSQGIASYHTLSTDTLTTATAGLNAAINQLVGVNALVGGLPSQGTNRSGFTPAPNSPQIVMLANANRSYWTIQNESHQSCWWTDSGLTPSVGGAGSNLLGPGEQYEAPTGEASPNVIMIVGSSGRQQFSALEVSITPTVGSLNTLAVYGTNSLSAQVLGGGHVYSEVLRWEQRVQVSVWAPTAKLREAFTDAFISVIGTDDKPFLDLGDGTSSFFRLSAPPVYKDDGQLSKNIYESHTIYTAEYSILSNYAATQVGKTTTTYQLPDVNQSISLIQGV